MEYPQMADHLDKLVKRNHGFHCALVRTFKGNDDKPVHQWAISIDFGGPIDFEGFVYRKAKAKPNLKYFLESILEDAINHYASFGSFTNHLADLVQQGVKPHMLQEYSSWKYFDANLEYLTAALRSVGVDWPSLVTAYKRHQANEVGHGA